MVIAVMIHVLCMTCMADSRFSIGQTRPVGALRVIVDGHLHVDLPYCPIPTVILFMYFLVPGSLHGPEIKARQHSPCNSSFSQVHTRHMPALSTFGGTFTLADNPGTRPSISELPQCMYSSTYSLQFETYSLHHPHRDIEASSSTVHVPANTLAPPTHIHPHAATDPYIETALETAPECRCTWKPFRFAFPLPSLRLLSLLSDPGAH